MLIHQIFKLFQLKNYHIQIVAHNKLVDVNCKLEVSATIVWMEWSESIIDALLVEMLKWLSGKQLEFKLNNISIQVKEVKVNTEQE